MILRYLPLAFKNSLRNRRRSILTISSVAASMCLLGVLFALYQALFMSKPVPGQELRLITYHKVSLGQALPSSYEAKIRQVPGVREVSVWQWFGGVYRDARDQRNFFARFGVEPDRFFTIHPEYEIPEEVKQKFLHERTAAIVEESLAKKFGWKPGEKITLVGDIFPVTLDLTLAGTYKDPEAAEALFFNFEYLRESMTGRRRDQVGSFSILAASEQAANTIAPVIDKLFDNAPEPTKTESEAAFALQFLSFLGNVKLFLMAICAAVTFTILLVSANTMAMSVRERIREVGVLKTLGYPNGAILGIILGEAALISFIGGIAGLLISNALVFVVRAGANGFQPIRAMSITPELAAFCLVFAVMIGVVSSLIPAAGAARTSILDALRSTV